MKTESKCTHQPATPLPQRSSWERPQGRASSSMPAVVGGMGDFGRAALGLVEDVTMLFDPSCLLEPPCPLTARPVRVLPRPTEQSSAPRRATEPGAGQRVRANSDLYPDDFKSAPRVTTSAPALVSSHGSSQVLSLGAGVPMPGPLQAPVDLFSLRACGVDALADVLLPARGANARLATAMMPPTTFCGFRFKPAAWRVSRLRDLMDDGNWQQVARSLPGHSPQRLVALALASCPVRESKGSFDRGLAGGAGSSPGAGWRMDSLILPASTTVPEREGPMALNVFGDRQAAAAIGSTCHAAAPGARMDCQDGVYLSPHCTLVTDGLGGHGDEGKARNVRVAQAATGQLVTHLVEAIARTERRPAEFLRRHLHALLQMVDHAVASALVAPCKEKDRADYVGAVQARAAFVGVANLPDGTVTFGLGDCTAHLFARENDGSLRVLTLTPQPNVPSAFDVGGLGDGTLEEGQFKVLTCPHGVVERVILGSDGVFDAQQGHLELVAGRTPSVQPEGRVRVGQHELAGMTPHAACEEIITRLTVRTRALWAARLEGEEHPPVAGLDDVALVVRDLKKPG